MPNWLSRLTGGGTRMPAPEATKAAPGSAPMQTLFAMTGAGEATWTGRSYASLVRAGYVRNPVVYRCIRLIAEAATRVPLVVSEGGSRLTDHPALRLLGQPNPRQSGNELLEAVYSYLLSAGNAYVEAVVVEGEVRGLYALRPDRMQVVTGRDGWPEAYAYTAGGRTRQLSQRAAPIPRVLHMGLFHPLDDHYGLAPLDAAQQSLDVHNAATAWNKALLDNAARPSGALVYSAAAGNLTPDQFERLKAELEQGFQGAMNAGRPMVLEGGLDWKTIALSPRDMDFIELKHSAAREIALALGVPPMLLGIPGDNTYANLAEANKALWRQTVIPLVRRVADDFGYWFAPLHGTDFKLVPDFDDVEALSEDRAALWARIGEAGFLSDEEKRRMLGVE